MSAGGGYEVTNTPSPTKRGKVGMGVREAVRRARQLRSNPTDAERKLWRRIRDKQLEGMRFRRQRPIGKYIADFVCLDARLVVEVDGGQHGEQLAYGARRTATLRNEGFRVLRFWNHDVLENIEGVLEVILNALQRDAEPTPSRPSPWQGKELECGDDLREGTNTPSPAKRGKFGMGVVDESQR
jgi:very-short-patch-repair endonuclease